MSQYIRGIQVILYLDNVELASCDSCNIEVSRDMIQLLSTSNGAKRYTEGDYGGNVTATGILFIDENFIAQSITDIFQNIIVPPSTDMRLEFTFE